MFLTTAEEADPKVPNWVLRPPASQPQPGHLELHQKDVVCSSVAVPIQGTLGVTSHPGILACGIDLRKMVRGCVAHKCAWKLKETCTNYFRRNKVYASSNLYKTSLSTAGHIFKCVLCGRCGIVNYHPLSYTYKILKFLEGGNATGVRQSSMLGFYGERVCRRRNQTCSL